MEFGDQASVAKIAGTTSTYSLPTEFPFRAVVIGQQDDVFTLFVEHEKNLNEPDAFFRLKATCSPVPIIRDVIEIHAAKSNKPKLDGNGVRLPPAIAPHREVTKYTIVSEPLKASHKEIVAVHETGKEYVTVAGSSFKTEPMPFFKTADKKFVPSSYLMVDAVPLLDCILEEIYDPDNGQKYFLYLKDFNGQNKNEDGKMEPIYYPSEPRNLTSEERKWVFNSLRAKKNINVDDCILYIQYPNVAAYLAEYFRQIEECRKATVTMYTTRIVKLKDGRVELQFVLSEEQSDSVIYSNIDNKWRCGVEMSVEHRLLKTGTKLVPAFFTITKDESQKRFIAMECTERSANLAKIILSDKKSFQKMPFKLCPQPPCYKNIVDAIETNFCSFVEERSKMFKLYCGRSKAAVPINIKEKKPFLVRADFWMSTSWTLSSARRPTRDGQWDRLLLAVERRIPSLLSLPSCRILIFNLKCLNFRAKDGIDKGVCLVANTNAAATNGADMTEKNFDGFKIIRQFSNKAEYEAPEKSRKIGLLHLAITPEGKLEKEDEKQHQMLLKYHKAAQKKFEKTKGDAREKLRNFDQLQTKEKEVQKNFLKKYNMDVYATTVEVLLREGDVFAHKGKAIKRLIFDEAAQLSPVEGLALYCRLPELTHICMLGDTLQLGPHSKLKENTMVHKFLTRGELTRMHDLKSTNKKNLRKIYRCHPEITRQLLMPIYGDQVEVGITENDRMLAKEKQLIVAEDQSAVVFVNVKGLESRGHNLREISVLLSLVADLTKKGIASKDLVILCNHRVQMDAIRERLSSEFSTVT